MKASPRRGLPFLARTIVVIAATSAVALIGLVSVPAATTRPAHQFALHRTRSMLMPTQSHLTSRTAAFPNPSAKGLSTLEATAGKTTIQTWKALVVAGQDGHDYPFTMVGTDIRTPSKPATIKTLVIPVTFTFPNTGDVYDPTVANTACGENQSALAGTLNGPLFSKTDYSLNGTSVGTTQFGDALQREELWQWAGPSGSNPGYHVYLKGSSPAGVSVTANGYPESQPGTCAQFGEISIGQWSGLLDNSIFPSLAADGVSPTTFTIFLFKNVGLFDDTTGQCCLVGYRSILNNPSFNNGLQSYVVADYDTTGTFSGFDDQSVLTGEVGAWFSNPFFINPTPSWGHIGPVKRCDTLLDADGPFFGSDYPLTIAGATYHAQELPFWGWFYNYNAGIDGLYSTRGSLTSAATLC